jgi:hypothetical protein
MHYFEDLVRSAMDYVGHHAHTENAEAFELRIMVVGGIGIDES